MERVEIRFPPGDKPAKARVQNLALELCEKVLEAGCETAGLQEKEGAYIIACSVRDASRAWSRMQDCLDGRGMLTRGTSVFVRRTEKDSPTQVYPIGKVKAGG